MYIYMYTIDVLLMRHSKTFFQDDATLEIVDDIVMQD